MKTRGFTRTLTLASEVSTRRSRATPKLVSGFIALISVIVIGLALLALVASASSRALFAGFDALDASDAAAAKEAARSCAESAALILARNANYEGGDSVTVGSATCRIERVASDVVTVSARMRDARAYGTARVKDGALASYEEIPTLPE